jgi:hypothetical protein
LRSPRELGRPDLLERVGAQRARHFGTALGPKALESGANSWLASAGRMMRLAGVFLGACLAVGALQPKPSRLIRLLRSLS